MTDLVHKPHTLPLANEKGEWILPDEEILEEILDEESSEDEESDGKIEEETISYSDDLYRSFVQRATRIARLSEEEERTLGLLVRDKNDKNATKKLVLHNMRLAIKMAHQYKRVWTNLMDLVQEGSAGLAIAAQRWDPDKGTRFGTYAAYWIRAQLTKFLITNGRLIHTANTRAGRKVYFSLPKIRRQLLAKGEEPTVERIAQEVGEDPKEVALILSRLEGRETSLNAPIGEDAASTLQDALATQETNPEENYAERQINQIMKDVVKRFEDSITEERDKAIWREHLISQDPLSLVELGKRYGVSKQRMGQLAIRLKRAFRRHIIDELGPHTELSWLFSED